MEKDNLVNERGLREVSERKARDEKEAERYEGSVVSWYRGSSSRWYPGRASCTAASSNRNPWRRSSRSAHSARRSDDFVRHTCAQAYPVCAERLLARTACGCGLTAPIGMARIGYWRSSNGIEQGSAETCGRGDKRERFL